MQTFKIMSVSPEERVRADADGNYAPLEYEVMSFRALTEVHALRRLRKMVQRQEVPMDSQLSW